MKRLRLMPVVVFATVALLLLKGLGLVGNGGYILVGGDTAIAAGSAQAQATDSAAAPPASEEVDAVPPIPDNAGGNPEDAADRASEALFGDEATTGGESTIEAPGISQEALTQSAVLESLGERRGQLDALEADLSSRQSLIEAAELRLGERMAALEAIEAKITAMLDEKKAMQDERFMALVAMYESMKPADAAAIFDNLEADVLLRVAQGMNPRRMAPILAKMTPGRAQELTVQMAAVDPEPGLEEPVDDLSELPQIIGQ